MKPIILIALIFAALPIQAKINACQQQPAAIHSIQGANNNSGLEGQEVFVKGIMTADFRGKKKLSGYFIQSLKDDNNDNTSEGLFIYENNLQLPIKVGDMVAVQGVVEEKFGVTQLSQTKRTKVCSSNHLLPEPVSIKLPLEGQNLENYEGMLVKLAEPYVISDTYRYVELGELVVSTQLLINPTSVARPGKTIEKLQRANRVNRLIIDDGSSSKFAEPKGLGVDNMNRISASNSIQLGQTLEATGIMHYGYGEYKLQPTQPVILNSALASSKPKPIDVGGQLKVASFNVENFFTTLDQGKNICGPAKDKSCRGADNKFEYQRQLDKLVSTINASEAAVVGLQELENNERKSAEALVAGLNHVDTSKQWGFIDTGALGLDAIKVGFIYQQSLLQPKGDFALLNQAADKSFKENRNRIIVAQTFEDQQGHTFNIATVHFKSKGCRNAEDLNLAQKDGQSCYNPTRVEVAKQLARWMKTDPTRQQAQASFIVGDFNSYQQEDPMVALKEAGFHNLADHYLPADNWTTSYRGAVGSLDYILANKAAQKLTTGFTQWHINSVSMDQFGYNTENLGDGLIKPEHFYQNDPYASSDHDVVIAGIEFR